VWGRETEKRIDGKISLDDFEAEELLAWIHGDLD